MSRKKRFHSTRTMKKRLQHWTMANNGPFRKPLPKKKAAPVLQHQDGKAEQTLTGTVSASDDSKEMEDLQV